MWLCTRSHLNFPILYMRKIMILFYQCTVLVILCTWAAGLLSDMRWCGGIPPPTNGGGGIGCREPPLSSDAGGGGGAWCPWSGDGDEKGEKGESPPTLTDDGWLMGWWWWWCMPLLLWLRRSMAASCGDMAGKGITRFGGLRNGRRPC